MTCDKCDGDESIRILENIKEYGWSVALFRATDYLPSFAYTIGLWKRYGHPEVISLGLSIETLHVVLNDVGAIVKSGEVISQNKIYTDFFEDGKAAFVNVDSRNIADYFGYAIELYQTKDFPALQLVWTDNNDKFPWENDFEEDFKFRQPLLDRNADFKFFEEKNLRSFTTRQHIELNKPIVRVVHDMDGDWQFLTGDQLLEDARIVALEQMTIRDKTLNEVFNLDYGEQAERENIGSKWIRSVCEE